MTVFPARAGMSLLRSRCPREVDGFPRTRGDEPHSKDLGEALLGFSPHARG